MLATVQNHGTSPRGPSSGLLEDNDQPLAARTELLKDQNIQIRNLLPYFCLIKMSILPPGVPKCKCMAP